jgi:hypothetical protein
MVPRSPQLNRRFEEGHLRRLLTDAGLQSLTLEQRFGGMVWFWKGTAPARGSCAAVNRAGCGREARRGASLRVSASSGLQVPIRGTCYSGSCASFFAQQRPEV